MNLNTATNAGFLFDTAPEGSEAYLTSSWGGAADPQSAVYLRDFAPSPLYTLAIDNFLCEANNMFVDGMASFVSAREEDYGEVRENSYYKMNVTINRTLQPGLKTADPNPLLLRRIGQRRSYILSLLHWDTDHRRDFI